MMMLCQVRLSFCLHEWTRNDIALIPEFGHIYLGRVRYCHNRQRLGSSCHSTRRAFKCHTDKVGYSNIVYTITYPSS